MGSLRLDGVSPYQNVAPQPRGICDKDGQRYGYNIV
jgi:hypothetical protein